MNNQKKYNQINILPIIFLIAIIVILSCLVFYSCKIENYALALSFIVVIVMLIVFYVIDKHSYNVKTIVPTAIMTALVIVGRSIFYYIPQFKPVVAITIITGVALGKKSGFLCGSLSMLISNFLFGQGLWTIWQMFGLGIVGLFSGCFVNSKLCNNTIFLCIWGFVASLVYGIIVDTWTLVAIGSSITVQYAITIYLSGLIFNLILAVASVVFIALLSKPLLKSLNRAKIKYNLIGLNQEIYDIDNYKNITE